MAVKKEFFTAAIMRATKTFSFKFTAKVPERAL